MLVRQKRDHVRLDQLRRAAAGPLRVGATAASRALAVAAAAVERLPVLQRGEPPDTPQSRSGR